MKLNQILILILSIFIIIIAINTVDAAEMDNCSEDVISSSYDNLDTTDEITYTYKATGNGAYIKDYNPKYKLSKKAKKQVKNVKKAPKKTYKLTINEDTYKSLKNAKKNKKTVSHTYNTNYKCKVLHPVLKSKTIKKTIVNKKYRNPQKYYNAYNKYFPKYTSNKYKMKVKFHFYKGTHNIKYTTIKVIKKVKQVKIIKFKTRYTNVKAEISYCSHNGELGKGSHLYFYGKTFGLDFTNFVASKHKFIL